MQPGELTEYVEVQEYRETQATDGSGDRIKEYQTIFPIYASKQDVSTKEFIEQGYNKAKGEVLTKFEKDLKEKLKCSDYDYVLSSDVLLPFANNLIHSNSSRYKSKNGIEDLEKAKEYIDRLIEFEKRSEK